MTPISHSQARLWIEQAADGILKAEQAGKLDLHLKGCAECRTYAAEFAALENSLRGALLARWPQDGLPSTGKKDLIKQLKSQFGKGVGGPAPWSGLIWLLPILLLALLAAWWLSSQVPPLAEETPTPRPTGTATATLTASATLPALPLVTDTPGELTLIAIPVQIANCREGNGTGFEVDDTLNEGESYEPNARGFDNLWVRFLGPVTENQCWVYVANLEFFVNNSLVAIEEVPETLLPYTSYPATPTPSPTSSFTPEPAAPECSDGMDNDGDGRVDYDPTGAGDRECRNANDNDETNP
ncbi:MAG: zf-HC2 domain-containing protein [Anaerolineales bacterium]